MRCRTANSLRPLLPACTRTRGLPESSVTGRVETRGAPSLHFLDRHSRRAVGFPQPWIPALLLASRRHGYRRPTPSGFAQDPPAEGRARDAVIEHSSRSGGQSDCLLFYRMGDYELFFEDAESQRAFQHRAHQARQAFGRDIPMCGVPVHRSDEYASPDRSATGSQCEQLKGSCRGEARISVVRRDVIRQ